MPLMNERKKNVMLHPPSDTPVLSRHSIRPGSVRFKKSFGGHWNILNAKMEFRETTTFTSFWFNYFFFRFVSHRNLPCRLDEYQPRPHWVPTKQLMQWTISFFLTDKIQQTKFFTKQMFHVERIKLNVPSNALVRCFYTRCNCTSESNNRWTWT